MKNIGKGNDEWQERGWPEGILERVMMTFYHPWEARSMMRVP